MSASLSSNQSATVTSFIDSIGINGTASATAAGQMAYLGIDHLRTGQVSASDLLAAGADGAKLDVILPWYMGAITSDTLQSFLSQIDPAASVIEAVEGPNEVNNLPDTYEGLTGPVSVETEQEELYTLSKADLNLNNATKSTAVYDFSVMSGTPAGAYSGMQGYADYNNVHAYGGPGIPPSWILPYEVTANTIAGDQPVVLTETGATTIPGTQGVDQTTQARYDLKALLDAYQLGVTRTYVYNIQDWAIGSSVGDFSAYYGLYNTDGTIKLAGTALHNFTTILSQGDDNLAAGSAPAYSLSGTVYYGNSELFSKGGGAFDLTLWNETADWNATAGFEVEIPTNNVTINLAESFGTIAVYDPLVSSNPIETATNASSITVALNDDPLIVQLTPPASGAQIGDIAPAPVTTGSGPDVLTLKISEDAYANGDGSDAAGDAAFNVSIDGQQQGGTFVAGAAHALGVEQVFSFDGYFGAGSHTVTITFLNDAYNLAAPDANGSVDRNLYVGDVIYNGTDTGQSGELTFDSSEAFVVTGGTPVPKPMISGTATGQTTTDETTVKPVSAVAINDANSSQSETVAVTLSATANGSLSNLGTGSYDAGTGVYTVTGTAAAVTNALDALVFTPTAHQVAPGATVTTGFAINATDTAGAITSNATTTVIATAANDPPMISGSVGGQATTDETTVKPFSSVAISDSDLSQSETVTVTLSAIANGSLSNLGSGSYDASKGVYTVAGTDGAVTSALDALVFTPTPQQVAPGGTVTTGFTIKAADTAGASTSNATATVIATATAPPVMGTTTIALNVSEDAWKGDAQFTVKVDGVRVGGVNTASALHSSGDSEVFVLGGTWASGAHQVKIQFINDAYGGTAATDRNLYINSIAVNGVTNSGTTATMMGNGTDTFTVGGTVPAANAPADKLTLNLSGDAWNGNAQFSLSIDGKKVSTPQDVTAVHSAAAWQAFSFGGNFGAGSHTIGITFANDAYGGTSTTDRNLYVNGIDLNGKHYGSGVTALYSNSTTSFIVTTAH
jgi:Ca-dependent carbohydrate-binding module xylan-binding